MNNSIKRTAGRLTALGFVILGTAFAHAAAPALNGAMDARPLTPQEKKDYSLTTLPVSGGLDTTGIGQPFYLDALANKTIPASNIVSVTWTLVTKPLGSGAVITNSPLGTNVPTYKVADRLTLQVAGRALLVPDVAGQYSVQMSIVTDNGSGTTNITKKLTAGTYLGVQTCALCHSGGAFADNLYGVWTNTLHSHAFKDAINGISTDHFGKNCVSCHVVGFDTNALAVNGGFDDVAAQHGWVFPTTITPTNWDAMPAALRGVANIQCESCHGPGSEHAAALGNTNVVNWPRLAVTMGAGDCAQCHDSLSHHYKTAEWNNSRHAIATRTPSGPNRANCVRCHTASGFAQFISNDYSEGTNTTYEAINCQTCHDPHDASNPHQLRAAPLYTLPDGTTVTNAGLGALCMQCHHSRNGNAETNIVNYKLGKPTWAGGSSFGVHDSPQGDMVEGVNAITYGKFIPSAAHRASVTNVCVGCHMQEVASTDPAFTKAGGHTFHMTFNEVVSGVTNTVDKVDVCAKCHGDIEDFNMVRSDYNGDGITEGVQTEVVHLLNKLSTYLPNSSGLVDGLVKSTLSVKTNWAEKHLRGAYNWQFVKNDGSFGIHNTPYAVGLLKASIADLSGDGNNDGLPDAWQIQYFGSTTNANAAPNAMPAGDGVPNWLKFSLGLNPTVPGITLADGIVWANTGEVGGTGQPVRIYTAAEIVFDTEVGKTYQIQGISTLGGGWSNIGSPVAGSGTSMSFMTSTRNNVQQFFRVVPSL
jgi:hypothetical protein